MKLMNYVLLGIALSFILLVPQLWWAIIAIIVGILLTEAYHLGKEKIDKATQI